MLDHTNSYFPPTDYWGLVLSCSGLLFALMIIWPILAPDFLCLCLRNCHFFVFVIPTWLLILLTMSSSDLLFAFMIIWPILAPGWHRPVCRISRGPSLSLCLFLPFLSTNDLYFFDNPVNAWQESHISFWLTWCLECPDRIWRGPAMPSFPCPYHSWLAHHSPQ